MKCTVPAITGAQKEPLSPAAAREAGVHALALAHGHPAPASNGLFYATATTSIPVLFLAIAVQGRAYDVLKAWIRISDRKQQRAPRRLLYTYASTALMVLARGTRCRG